MATPMLREVMPSKRNEVNAGEKQGSMVSSTRIRGQHVEQVGGVGGLGGEGGQADHQGGHLEGAQDQPPSGDAVLVHSPQIFGKLPSWAARLPAPTSIIQEPSEVKQARAVKAETKGATSRRKMADDAMAKGAPEAATTGREHAADHLGERMVDDAGDGGTQHGGEQVRCAWVLHHAGGDGGRFNTDEGPEADQHGADDRMQIAAAGGVPVLAVDGGIKMAPAHHGSTDDRQQDQHQSQGTEPAHPAAAQQVDEGEDPDRRYGGCGGRNGVVEDGEEDREVGDAGDGDGQVAYPVRVVVEHAGLEAEHGEIRRRRRWGRPSCGFLVARRANTKASPMAPTRQMAQLNREMEPMVARGRGQQRDAAPHHVAGHHTCTGDEADLLARI